MMAAMNDNIMVMTQSISSMGNTLKRLLTPNLVHSQKKRRVQDLRSQEDSDIGSRGESSDSAESSRLLSSTNSNGKDGNGADKTTEDPSEKIISDIAQGCDTEEKTTGAATQKLADFVHKLFSTKLGEAKLNDKLDKYARPKKLWKTRSSKQTKPHGQETGSPRI